jgi:hypothetical protein
MEGSGWIERTDGDVVFVRIWTAETKKDALAAFYVFVETSNTRRRSNASSRRQQAHVFVVIFFATFSIRPRNRIRA